MQAAKELNTEEKKHIYALTMAEVGRKSPVAQKALMETMYNRYAARPSAYKSFSEVYRSKYYQPLHPGQGANYYKALKDLENDPDLFTKMDALHNEVLAGSNESNFATHNSSASVADSAEKTQTVTNRIDYGGGYETFSRKDQSPGVHGAKAVQEESAWFQTTQTQMEQFIQASEQTIGDASSVPEQDPSQTGTTTPDVLPKKKQTLTALPDGIDQGVKDHFGKLEPQKQADFLKKVETLGIEEVNKLYNESKAQEPNKPESVVIREKTSELLSAGTAPVLERQQNAGRYNKIDPRLNQKIGEAVYAVYGPGYEAVVTSGGEPVKGKKVSTSGRHNVEFDKEGNMLGGQAADFHIIEKSTGRRLNREEQLPLAQYWQHKGHGGVGLGMRGDAIHLDQRQWGTGKGDLSYRAWGYEGKYNGQRYLTRKERAALLDAQREDFDITSIAKFTKASQEAIQTASQVPEQNPAQTGTTEAVALETKKLTPNMEGLDLQGFKYPEGMPEEAVKYWNSRSLEWRQKQIDEGWKTRSWMERQFASESQVRDALMKKWNDYQALPPEERARLDAESAAPTAKPIVTESSVTGRMEGGVVTETNGQPRDPSTYSEEERKRVNAARDLGRMMGNESPPPIEAPKAPETKQATQTGAQMNTEGIVTTAPAMKAGGEHFAGEDLAVVKRGTGEPVAFVNSGETLIAKNPERNADELMAQSQKANQASAELGAVEKKHQQTQQNQSNIVQRPNSIDSTNQHTLARNESVTVAQGNLTPAATRAFARANFKEVGEHFASGAANIKV